MENPISGTPANTTTGKKSFTLPLGQVNHAALGIQIGKSWETKFSNVSFGFTNVNDFKALAEHFNSELLAKKTLLAQRKILTRTMADNVKKINSGLKYLKGYISEKFGSETAKTHFADFGIVLNRGYLSFPTDHDQLIASLNMTVNALAANPDIASRTYGLSYWKELRDNLQSQWDEAIATDNNLATYTRTLQQDFTQLKAQISRLKTELRLDNPKDYQQVWREWGLHKEKF